ERKKAQGAGNFHSPRHGFGEADICRPSPKAQRYSLSGGSEGIERGAVPGDVSRRVYKCLIRVL
ncbi:hypothetical protein JS562_50620, partial [Agrobacterium sp. S2]|nr:hypothetical protein [Agrobacterium sp. S2]